MRGFRLVFAILLLASSLVFAVSGLTTTPTLTTVNRVAPVVYVNNTTSSGVTTGSLTTMLNLTLGTTGSSGSGSVLPLFRTDLLSIKGEIISPLLTLALQSGPYAYAVSGGNVIVIDTTKREVVSVIKPEGEGTQADAVAVSPDGKYIYMAISWAIYQDDYYGGHYDRFARVARLNASTQQAIDYFQFDGTRPEHLAVAPDGKVYMGFQLAYYPDSAGVKIMDFSQGKSWYLDYKNAFMLQNFEFDSTGKNAYYAGWWDYPGVYRLNWDTNKVSYYQMPGNISNSYEYVRSIATAKGGKMLYAAVNRNKGIVATNTQDGGMKIITADYVPVSLAASRDGETLYAIGYFYDSSNKPVYLIHKYRGLNAVGPPYGGLFNWLLSTSEAFQFDSTSYITPPSGNYPSNMEVSADGRWGYITTSIGDGASYGYGDAIIVYDLEYMNQVRIIERDKVRYGIAVSPEQIYYSPTPDLSWAKDFAASTLPGSFSLLDGSLLVKKFYPEKGSFAKDYKTEFFVIYAAFTDNLDNTTVSNSTFWLTEKSGTNVPGKARAASAIAIFSPESQLKASTDYVVHLSKSIKSKDGKPLYADVQWNFTTRNLSFAARVSPNSTLNFSLAKGLALVGAGKFTLPVETENNSGRGNRSSDWLLGKGSALASRMPGSLSDWAKKGVEFGQENTTDMQGGINGTVDNEIEPGEGFTGNNKGSSQTPSPELNPQPEPPGPENIGKQAPSPELNPQPEPPALEKQGNLQGQQGANQLNPQPEPPAPQKGIIEAIAEFFAGLFGWK